MRLTTRLRAPILLAVFALASSEQLLLPFAAHSAKESAKSGAMTGMGDMSDMQNMPGMSMPMAMPKNKKGQTSSSKNAAPAKPGMPGMGGMNDMSEMSNMPGMQTKESGNLPGPRIEASPSLVDTNGGAAPDPIPAQQRRELRLEFNVYGEPDSSQNPISLPELEKLAVEHNPTLIQSRTQIEGELGKAQQAGLFPNPGMGYSGDLLGLRGAGGGEWQGAMLQQEVILGGKLKLSRQKYLARVDAAKQQAVAQSYKVKNDVQTHYYRVLAALARLKMQNELWKSTRDRWLTVGEMANLGEASQADRHLANATQEEQRLQVLEAENDLMLAWENLTAVVGLEMPYRKLEGELEGEPVLVPWQNLENRLIKDSPQMGEALAKLRSDEITLKREQRQKIPNVVMSAGAGYDQLDKSFAARANLQVVNIPLFDRNQGTVQQARADLDRQKAQVQLLALQLRRALAHQYRQYVTAVQHVQAYKKVILPQLQARYALMLKSYEDTRTDWPAVLESQRDFFEKRLAYIHHLEEWRAQEVLINGFLLTGALNAPEGITPPGHIDATPKPR
ncbi:MAG: TolC family protein [Candidatus Obscuribacterales bacterium]|nr:TolC family protein [Candidatus Obscuribacterales bacterium]